MITKEKLKEIVVRHHTKSVENFIPEKLDDLYGNVSHLYATSRDVHVWDILNEPDPIHNLKKYRSELPKGDDWSETRAEITSIICYLELNFQDHEKSGKS